VSLPWSRQTEMPLKVVSSVQIQCQAAAVRRVDCSKFSDPRPRNSCPQVECLFSEQWRRWRIFNVWYSAGHCNACCVQSWLGLWM